MWRMTRKCSGRRLWWILYQEAAFSSEIFTTEILTFLQMFHKLNLKECDQDVYVWQ